MKPKCYDIHILEWPLPPPRWLVGKYDLAGCVAGRQERLLCSSVTCRMRGCHHQLPMFSILCLCLLPLGVLTRPQAQPQGGQQAAVGGQIGRLVSDIYNDIIQSRLKNLLKGVSPSSSPSSPPPSSISSLASTLLETSDALRNRGRGGKGEDPQLEVSLPKSVTPIPSELFTSLPGSHISTFSAVF